MTHTYVQNVFRRNPLFWQGHLGWKKLICLKGLVIQVETHHWISLWSVFSLLPSVILWNCYGTCYKKECLSITEVDRWLPLLLFLIGTSRIINRNKIRLNVCICKKGEEKKDGDQSGLHKWDLTLPQKKMGFIIMEMINSLKCFKIDQKHLEMLDKTYQVFLRKQIQVQNKTSNSYENRQLYISTIK